MRVRPGWFAWIVLLFAVGMLRLAARDGAAGNCPLGTCPACGACFHRPPVIQPSARDSRVA